MLVAVTGASGFLGRYIVRQLCEAGHHCRCWKRHGSDVSGFEDLPADRLEWIDGELGEESAAVNLVNGAAALVHGALWRPGAGFRGTEGDVVEFVERNLLGSLRLFEAAKRAGVPRVIFISTCAVYEMILKDRPLDEKHPLYPASHYGAHKAAIEKFVHAYGLRDNWQICSLRPTGIYGLAHPAHNSKWFDLVQKVKRGERLELSKGGKEVHAADVARAVERLLTVENVAGQSYNCYDMYVSDGMVARLAKQECGGKAEIIDSNSGPKNQIDTTKLRALGFTFRGQPALEAYVRELVRIG